MRILLLGFALSLGCQRSTPAPTDDAAAELRKSFEEKSWALLSDQGGESYDPIQIWSIGSPTWTAWERFPGLRVGAGAQIAFDSSLRRAALPGDFIVPAGENGKVSIVYANKGHEALEFVEAKDWAILCPDFDTRDTLLFLEQTKYLQRRFRRLRLPRAGEKAPPHWKSEDVEVLTPTDGCPQLSASKDVIAWREDEKHMHVADLREGIFSAHRSYEAPASELSPDGRWLAFAEGNAVFRLDVATGLRTEIARPGDEPVIHAISPDSRWLLVEVGKLEVIDKKVKPHPMLVIRVSDGAVVKLWENSVPVYAWVSLPP